MFPQRSGKVTPVEYTCYTDVFFAIMPTSLLLMFIFNTIYYRRLQTIKIHFFLSLQ
jgi:hypothetical protein